MIFVTLGTQACDFSRCMKMVEKLIKRLGIKDQVIAQTGYTTYHPSNVECVDFVSEEKYQCLMQKADVVISHAGTGALLSSIKKGKKVIAVARLAEYGEMVNDHQTEIVKKLSAEGLILDGTRDLESPWIKLSTFNPGKNDFECRIPQRIDEILVAWGIRKKVDL